MPRSRKDHMPTRAGPVVACCVLWVPFTGIEGQTEADRGVRLRARQTVRVRLADGRTEPRIARLGDQRLRGRRTSTKPIGLRFGAK